MRKMICSVLLMGAMVFSSCSACFADNYDFPNMTTEELNAVKDIIDEEIRTNHRTSSSEDSAIEKATKQFVEDMYGEDNVDWAWFDYTYTKDWNFYTMKTHADIRKQDGGKAEYNIYSEVVANGDNYQVAYVKIGEEEVLNNRSALISDQRILRQLGLENQATELKETAEAPDALTKEVPAAEAPGVAETPLAKNGDKNDVVRTIQEMLTRLGYLGGTPDGSFGQNTENAVKNFQTDNGFAPDGIVTQSVYDAMSVAAASAPEPEEVINISAYDLYNAFDDNSIAAEAAYTGKKVQVTGKIGNIDESWGTPYVSLDSDEYGFTSILCRFKEDDKAQLATFSTGQTLTILGTCGDMGFASVTVNDCKIVG